MFYHKF